MRMDKAQAINTFWNSFGIPAYDEQTVPDTAQMPYMTYELSTDNIGNTVNLSASLWYHSTSWAAITQKAEEIAANIGYGFRLIRTDDGGVYITRGTPFAQRMEADDGIRRIVLQINAEYLTAY